MRQGQVIAFSILFLLGAAATAAARQGNPQNVGGTATTTTKTHKKAAHCTFKGAVASVDATGKSFVVHPAKGDDVTLKVNDKTTYGKGKTWDDVKADAMVSGTCKKDGADTWAVSVKFWPAKKAKAEAAPKSGNPGDVGGPPTKTGSS